MKLKKIIVFLLSALALLYLGARGGAYIASKYYEEKYISKENAGKIVVDFAGEVLRDYCKQTTAKIDPVDAMLKWEQYQYYHNQNAPKLEIKDYLK